MWTRIVSNAIFPLHEYFKRHSSVALRREMEESQWWSAERLQVLQLERLRTLLADVAVNVPYYRDLFSRLKFDPTAVRGLEDLQALPLLDKPTIRAHTDAMKHQHARGLARFNTGGSSGEPLIFFIGNERVSHDVAAKWRATRWWGVDIGDPEIVVWGSPIELGSQDRVRAWRDKLLRTELLPAFEMSESRLDGFVAAIRRRKPKMLFGYPSALSHIANHAVKRGQGMDDLGIKVAFVTSERLYDEQRSTISRVFGCPVANGYGGRDAGFIAHQCPQGGMHLTAEDLVVEIVGREGRVLAPGQSGEIVVTHLATGDFPFIRYRTGDVATLSSERCACGRGLPLIEKIEGRTTDFVVAVDGTVLHGLALIYVLRDLPGVRQFKIIQETLLRVRILVVTDDDFDQNCVSGIREKVRARLGNPVEITVEQVEKILPERSGKYRYVVSHVTQNQQMEASNA
ncbi:MAG: phenylacetate--CoA ligase family protein [Pseudomonadota bacterium]|nr:phenylacetate--CoA ligase family protein [Pseudomonadota bacterium]